MSAPTVTPAPAVSQYPGKTRTAKLAVVAEQIELAIAYIRVGESGAVIKPLVDDATHRLAEVDMLIDSAANPVLDDIPGTGDPS